LEDKVLCRRGLRFKDRNRTGPLFFSEVKSNARPEDENESSNQLIFGPKKLKVEDLS